MPRILRLALLVLPLIASAASARPMADWEVPDPLRPWVSWVLTQPDARNCPLLHPSGERRCVWPTSLDLELYAGGARFTQEIELFAEAPVMLPGDAARWPQDVDADGLPVAVTTDADGRPMVKLRAGRHRLQGRFLWSRSPESLPVPPGTGLLRVTVDGTPLPAPSLSATGELWLQDRDAGDKQDPELENRLELRVFRRIVDDLPMQVHTRIDLDVAGRSREVLLGQALLPEFIPLALTSPLPARLEPDGRLRVQVRPGHWTIILEARHAGMPESLTAPRSEPPWVEAEIWVFDPRTALRLVEIESPPAIDPRQTSLPQDWQQLAAYRLAPGDSLVIRTVRRGDSEPEPDQLHLSRELWLDFDGGGYTVADTISGRMTRAWRLDAAPGLQLGRVTLDGQPQFITRLDDSGPHGVEVRRGQINLSADSRIEGVRGQLGPSGWLHDFQSAEATLNLPPGWTLFMARGVDNVPDTWVAQWTLLDIFLALIATLAAWRLWGWKAGVLSLVTLALVWQEPAAPRQVWLHVLAATALLRVLPTGRARRLVGLYRVASVLVLAVLGVTFAVHELRTGFYPQLERPWQSATAAAALRAAAPVAADSAATGSAAPEEMLAEPQKSAKDHSYYSRARPAPPPAPQAQDTVLGTFDPRANVQTGPGLPRWQWTSVPLRWNGPLPSDQPLTLTLIPPPLNLALAVLRVLLLALLIALVSGWRAPRMGTPVAASMAAALLLLAAPPPAAADFPSPELLQELRSRLEAPPDCLPACASSPLLRIAASPDRLTLSLQLHAAARVAVPLPANLRAWMPAEILVDGVPAAALLRSNADELWLTIDAGVHDVTLTGPAPTLARLQLSLPLRPHRVEVDAEGWQVEGLNEDGVPDGQLVLTRAEASSEGENAVALEPSAMPPFVLVERRLRLGLEWRVHTRIQRVSPPGTAIVLAVPLIEGESVTSAGVRVVDGKAQVALAPQESETTWESVLEMKPALKLTAPSGTDWTERWLLEAGPIWHTSFEGPPPVHHLDNAGSWLPEWRPLAGESLAIHVTRPHGVEGRTLTIDSSLLEVTPGRRATDARLELSLRSSRGATHTLTLPEHVQLQSVSIDGSVQPVRQDGRQVTLNVRPGPQDITLSWREERGIDTRFRAPAVDLGAPSVNSSVVVNVPQDRWILLTGGPRLGPAILFWSVLAVVAVAALGLGRLRWTPLRAPQWFLLGIGLTQVPVASAVLAGGWLLALGVRERLPAQTGKAAFNLVQIGLFLLTLIALGVLFDAIRMGLLGTPDMQISGNASTAYTLKWYEDRIGAALPSPWILSVPLGVYRGLMLAWALWLASALLGWLRWGYACYASQGLWRPFRLYTRAQETITPPKSG